MEISVTVQLGSDDSFAYTPDAAAAQVIAALGGNPTKDHCTVSIQQAAVGTAGTPTTPAQPPTA